MQRRSDAESGEAAPTDMERRPCWAAATEVCPTAPRLRRVRFAIACSPAEAAPRAELLEALSSAAARAASALSLDARMLESTASCAPCTASLAYQGKENAPDVTTVL